MMLNFIDFQEGSDAVSVIFGLAAATGLGLLAFTEVRILNTNLFLLFEFIEIVLNFSSFSG